METAMQGIREKILRYREKMLSQIETFRPFEITFFLSSPISLTFPWLFFDGIISHLTLKEALGDDYYNLPSKTPIGRIVPEYHNIVPIKQTQGVFHASVSIFEDEIKKVDTLYKRFEDRYIPKTNRKRIPVGSGYYKSYAMKIIYFPVEKVTFYVNGSYETILRLCEDLQGLGSETRIGWGAIKKIESQLLENDFSLVKNGIAMRPLPIRMLTHYVDTAFIASKPPYWDNANVEECAVPFTEVVLGKNN